MTWISENWITRDSFEGVLTYPSNQSDELDKVIELVAKKVLQRLLGHELYNLFIAEGYTAVTTNDYYKLREGTTITSTAGVVWNYDGLGDMLRGFVIAEELEKTYQINKNFVDRVSSSNSELLSITQQKSIAFDYYNKALTKYYEAKDYLYENKETFVTWKFAHLPQKSLIR